ncbi:MAG TPA: right-handed parallel beta-helix repeat-containing protein [Gaiellaceae bacterium]|nr:right-handed parallel beta-helix repeat-containing protein [Gaiellaceae bacterium]
MGHTARRRVAPAIALAATAACLLTVGASPALAATVVCGQVITQSTQVGNDLTNCPADGLVIGAPNIKLDLGGHVVDGVGAAGSAGIANRLGFANVTIEHGTVQQFGNGVLLLNATGNEVAHLTVTQNFGSRGIQLQGSNGNRIEHNKVFNNFDGIHLIGSDANRIRHNDVYGNTASAIVLITGSDDNRVDHNFTHDNPSWGLTQDGNSNGNRYEHNHVFNNRIAGIEPFNSSDLVISKNKVYGNRIGIELFNADKSTIAGNHIRGSTLDGIHSFQGSSGNLFSRNHADRNNDDGIDIADAGNTITKNHAGRNGDLGIFAAAGNTDGGGNKAKHNGNPAQCVGVTCH